MSRPTTAMSHNCRLCQHARCGRPGGEEFKRISLRAVIDFAAGESWRYQPDINHTVCLLALSDGQLLVPDTAEAGELAILEI